MPFNVSTSPSKTLLYSHQNSIRPYRSLTGMQDPFISIDYSSPAAFSSIMGPTKNRSSLSISHLLGQRHRLSSHRYKPLPWELHFASHTSSSRLRPYGNHQYLGHTGTLSPTVGTSPESHYLDHIDFASMLSVPRSCGIYQHLRTVLQNSRTTMSGNFSRVFCGSNPSGE